VDLQAVKTSINTWTRSLKGDIMDTKKDFHRSIENTRNNLHEELDLMIQVKEQTVKTEIRINQEKIKAKI
jgi:glutamine synthetase type III